MGKQLQMLSQEKFSLKSNYNAVTKWQPSAD